MWRVSCNAVDFRFKAEICFREVKIYSAKPTVIERPKKRDIDYSMID